MAHHNQIKEQFDRLASDYDSIKKRNEEYYRELKFIFSSTVKPGSNVLEIGCGTASILASLNPKTGVGIDISSSMIGIAKKRYPMYSFFCSSIEDIALKSIKTKFDYILLPDVVEYLSDYDAAFSKIRNLSSLSTKILITSANPFWIPILALAEKLGMKMQDRLRKWPSSKKIARILDRNGFKVERYYTRLPIPFGGWFFRKLNKSLGSLPIIKRLGLVMVFVASLDTFKYNQTAPQPDNTPWFLTFCWLAQENLGQTTSEFSRKQRKRDC